MIEAGGGHELIGRFPTIVNYDILDKTSICRIICQIITSLEDEYNCDIKLSDEFQEDLLKLANGQFGCRLINNVLSERILEQYALALYSYEQDNNKRLVITLDVDNSSYRYRNLTEEEIAEKELQEEYENLLNQK